MYRKSVRRRKTRRRSRRLKATRKIRGGSNPEKKVDLVIARYNEKLEWLDKYKERGFNTIYIYNKSTKPISCPPIENKATKCDVHTLPNVGMCHHTYLHHIVHHYDTLADITIFVPGSANNDHKADITDFTIGKAFETKNSVMNTYTFDIGVGEAMYNMTMPTYRLSYKNNYNDEPGEIPQELADTRPFGEWYAKNFPGEQIKSASFFGIMAMSREHIHRKPKSFYEGLLSQVDKHKFPEAAHFIERSWTGMIHPVPQECIYTSPTFEQIIRNAHNEFKDMRRDQKHSGAEQPAAPATGDKSEREPTFHVVIATAGRPQLKDIIDSLKGELKEGDGLTIIFDGKYAKKNSRYDDSWKDGFKNNINIIEQVPGLKHYGHGSLNKYAAGAKPETTYMMFADDDDKYIPDSFNILRTKCTDPHTLYIAKMKNDIGGIIIPPRGFIEIKKDYIGKPNGIIPYNDVGKAQWGIGTYTGDFDYYNELKDKVKNIVFLEDIIYSIGDDIGDSMPGNNNSNNNKS